METIHAHIRDIAASMSREADFLSNVKQTWEAAGQDFQKFVRSFKPFLDNVRRMGERYISLKEIMKAVQEGTEGKVMVTPGLYLKEVSKPDPKLQIAIE